MQFEPFTSLIRPERIPAARDIYRELTTQGETNPDVLAARLHEQGLLSDAGFRRYHAESTIVELTVVRDHNPPDIEATIPQTPPDTEYTLPYANGGLPTSGFGISAITCTAEPFRYDLLGRLSAGAMGEIQVAKDRDLRRKVAYKQLLDGIEEVPGLPQRFLLEAQVMAQLDHPNVVPVYTLERLADDRFAYAMKLVRGQTLAELLQEARDCVREHRPLPAELSRETLLDHFLKVCDAMAYAHSKQVLHRDLKPANIMVGQFREVYVMDWGLARVTIATDSIEEANLPEPMSFGAEDPTASRTRIGQALGTPPYMSPEQAHGDNASLDARSDIYALGLILFELLALQRALQGQMVEEILEIARRGEKKPLQAPAPHFEIPSELQAIVAKATAPTRYNRYQTVTELADDIRHFLNNEPISALPDTPVRIALRWIGRHRQTVLLMFMGLLLVTFGAIAWSFYQHAATLTETQKHKERLSRYLSAVSERSHLIEKQFLFFDELLEGLATATVEARMRGTPSTDAIYRLSNFHTPGQGPPDLAPSSQYRGAPISIEYPVHILWAGEPGSVLKQTLSRLAPLRHQFSRMFLLSHPEKNPYLPLADARRIIGTEGVPLIWSYIALREGAVIVYPGHDIDVPEGYDPRQRPWYQMAAGKNGKFWGNPHVDSLGQGLLLSCAMSLYDETGQFLGVAGVDLTFDYIIDELMTIADLPLLESFLIDEQGRIVISSSERDPDAFTSQSRPLYPDPEIVAELKTGQFDYREVERDDREIWIVYDDLETLGWSYLAEFAPE